MNNLRDANIKIALAVLFLVMSLFVVFNVSYAEAPFSGAHCPDKEVLCNINKCGYGGHDVGSIHIGTCLTHLTCEPCDDSQHGRKIWVERCKEKYAEKTDNKDVFACIQRSKWSSTYDCYNKDGDWCGSF
jgi:hypothetical protein